MRDKIKVVNADLETDITISEDEVSLLIVKNPNQYYKFVSDLISVFNGGESRFVFLKNGERADAEKTGVLVNDVFCVNLNDKKILSALYKRMETVASGAENARLFNELNTKIAEFVDALSAEAPFGLDTADIAPSDIFKAAQIKAENKYESLAEKIAVYINACVELRHIEFFVFINLKSVLDDERLKSLYGHCRAEKVGLLLVENAELRPLLPEERATIITEDLCEIVVHG